jgi:hypothetical protein
VNFAEGQKAVTVSTIIDEGRLQRRLDARYLGEIDISLELLASSGFEIELVDPVSTNHDHPGFLGVGGIDKHFASHLGVSLARFGGGKPSILLPGRGTEWSCGLARSCGMAVKLADPDPGPRREVSSVFGALACIPMLPLPRHAGTVQKFGRRDTHTQPASGRRH